MITFLCKNNTKIWVILKVCVYNIEINKKETKTMPEKQTNIEIDLQIKSTAELDESVKKDLEQEDKSIASLLEEEGDDGTS
jgi:hypothetical protein